MALTSNLDARVFVVGQTLTLAAPLHGTPRLPDGLERREDAFPCRAGQPAARRQRLFHGVYEHARGQEVDGIEVAGSPTSQFTRERIDPGADPRKPLGAGSLGRV